MANMTGGDNKVLATPQTTDVMLKIGNETVSVTTTFFDGQAVGRDASGLLVQMDDTAKAEFIGIILDLIREPVLTSNSANDIPYMVDRPQLLEFVKIASAAQGDEGKKVYWLYNNQVQYTPGSFGNLAGTVFRVIDSTHVAITPPWYNHCTRGPNAASITEAATGNKVLTKWDVNTLRLMPISGSVSYSLPVSTTVSPGDAIEFIKTTSGAVSVSLVPQGSDSINGAASNFDSSTVQFGITKVQTDGAGKWYAKSY